MEWEKVENTGIWMPEKEGDEIEGEIKEITEGTYGQVYVIKTKDDEIRLPSHKVLQTRLSTSKAGDLIKVVYQGEEPPSVKGQNPTKIYEVYRAK